MELEPYLYTPDKSLIVYKETEKHLNFQLELLNQIKELGWIYHNIGMIIPHNTENFWSGHNFPHNESWDELQVSFNLVCFGFYKQAFVSLRSGLELGLLSVYYNINDEGHKTVKAWLNSRDIYEANTPRAKKIWDILLSNNNIFKFNEKHNLKIKYDNLGYLHNYVHTKGIVYSNNMGILKGNSQYFEPKIIDKWFKSYFDIITLICTLHLLKYPIAIIRFDYRKKFGIDIPSFGGLEEFNIDKIAKILPEDYLKDIEEIAREDITTQQVIREISSFPNMTDEQVEEQIINLEKCFIENGEGFKTWLKHQKKLLKLFGESEFDEIMKNRIKILRKWAIENNFLESKSKRLGWDF